MQKFIGMKTLKLEKLLSYSPCYSQQQVENIYRNRTDLTLDDILNLDIPTIDKIWVLIQDWYLDETQVSEFQKIILDKANVLMKECNKELSDKVEILYQTILNFNKEVLERCQISKLIADIRTIRYRCGVGCESETKVYWETEVFIDFALTMSGTSYLYRYTYEMVVDLDKTFDDGDEKRYRQEMLNLLIKIGEK